VAPVFKLNRNCAASRLREVRLIPDRRVLPPDAVEVQPMGMTNVVQLSSAAAGRGRPGPLSGSARRLLEIVRRNPLPISVSGVDDGRIVEINEAWLKLFGFSRSEVVGRTSYELGLWVEPEKRAELAELIREEESLRDIPVHMRKKSGQAMELHLSATCLRPRRENLCVATYGDLTQVRRAEKMLRESEERFAKIFQASPDAIVISRLSDGRYVEVNQAWLEVFGYSREEIVGRTSTEIGIWVDAAERARLVRSIVDHRAVRNFETRMRRKNGEIADIRLSAEAFDLDGEAHIIVPLSDVTERRRADERIQQLATRDALTGLPNRLLLSDRLALAISNAQRGRSLLGLLFIDLDRFKNINDSLGHAVGDALLREVAERLAEIIRKGDTLARLGGDEFVVLLEDMNAAEDAGQVARKILEAFAEPFDVDGQSLRTACSIGISLFPSDAQDVQTLIRYADTAMYQAKDDGRSAFRYFSSEMNAKMLDRMWLEHGLREALALGQLQLAYQPKVNVESGRVTGVEALLRWRHPEIGLIPPDRFIAVAEESGLIGELGMWALDEACKQVSKWTDAGYPAVPVAVNLSVRQFNRDLAARVAETLRRTGIDPKLIELEITESLFTRNPDEICGILAELAALGLRLSIDDFGTGYSSLNYIKRFLVNSLKIDRSFVSDIIDNPQDVAIIRAVIAMARSLGIKVIAEGVELVGQLHLLRQLECDEYQGYLFSRPIAALELERRYLANPGSISRPEPGPAPL
jgi:diguanylate cyclase (GGDEF)-like protein/PAS domain S-box-containing protein